MEGRTLEKFDGGAAVSVAKSRSGRAMRRSCMLEQRASRPWEQLLDWAGGVTKRPLGRTVRQAMAMAAWHFYLSLGAQSPFKPG
jgi:hypothetical protein